MEDTEFLISFYIVKFLFSFCLPLCKQLQKVQIDLKKTIAIVENVVITLKAIRDNYKTEFSQIYINVKMAADNVGIELKKKRVISKQTLRDNPNLLDCSIEHYYCVTVFLPYVDYYLMQLTERFINHKAIFEGFNCIFQSESLMVEMEDIVAFQKLVEFYSSTIDQHSSIAELKMWRVKLVNEKIVFTSGLHALDVCDKEFYPNIHELLKIFCTLPVSTATPERCFSSLKRIKSYLRNSMTENRLNGLALLACHRSIQIMPDEVIDELSIQKNRKLDFVL
ncbi:unnamed protein product [Macrosiphum euphorbiae]|nr:unnamed protein product [Macrosiphum euphorbiae]